MNKERYAIHDNPGAVLDCNCVVEVTADRETVGMSFPQITHEHDNIGPSVYACMNGTKLTVRVTGSDDVEWGFEWSESERKWYQRDFKEAK